MALGSLGIELYASSARLEGDMGRAAQIVESRARAMDQAAVRARRSIDGIGDAGGRIGRINGIREAANDMNHFGHTTTAARRELLVLAHELSQGNYKRFAGSLMVLGEQMDWMGKIMSPTGIKLGLLGGAALLVATAFVKGAMESAHFRESIQLTGNYAGVTEGQFNAMAHAVANNANVTIHTAREMTQAFVSTGRFSGASLEMITMAGVRLAELTGQKSEEVVKDLTKMRDGVTKWAFEANKQYHFVDGALYDHIKKLEDQGRAEEAAYAAAKALYDHLGGQSVRNLGYLEAAWKGVKEMASAAWDAMLDIGRTKTVDDGLEAATKEVNRVRGAMASPTGGMNADIYQKQLTEGLARATEVARRKMRADDNALLQAQKASNDEQAVEAKAGWARRIEAHHEGIEAMNRDIAAARRQGALAGAPQAEIDAEVARIRKSYEKHDRSTAGIEKADLTSQLQPLQAQITSEDKLLRQREALLQRYYKDDKVSIQDYYATRRTIMEANIARTSALYDREIAIVEAAAARTKDARTNIELTTKANELREKKQQALIDSSEQMTLLTEAQARDTENYRQEVIKLTAELDKLRRTQSDSAGEEFDRTHRNIANQAKVAGDTNTLQEIAAARAAALAQSSINTLKQKAQVIEENLAIVEKRINLQTQIGQESELQGMHDIGAARAQALTQLQAISDQMNAIAGSSGLPALVTEADQFKLKVDELKASSDVLGKTFNDIFASSFARMIDSAVSGTKSLKQNFLDMANSIEQAITRMVAQDLANRLFGFGNGGGGNTGGGLFGMLFSTLGMGGGSSAAAAGAGVQVGGAMDLSMPIATPLATGGPAMWGGTYQVAESGPEMLTVANRTYLMMGNNSGRVTPVSDSGAGGPRNTFNMNIAVPPGTTRATAQQQASEIMRHAQIAMARNS